MHALSQDCFTTISVPSVEKLRVFHSIPHGVDNPPRLLFLHGYSFFTDLYATLLNELCSHFEVLAFDSPGTGGSGPIFDGDYTLNTLVEVALELLTVNQLKWVPRAASVLYKANMKYDPDRMLDSQSGEDKQLAESLAESLALSTDRKKFTIVGHSMGAFLAAELTAACWNCVEAVYLVAPAGIKCELKNFWSDLCGGALGIFRKAYAKLRHKQTIERWVAIQRDSLAQGRSVTHAEQMQKDFSEAYLANSKAAVSRFCCLVDFPWSGGHDVFRELESIIEKKGLNAYCYLMEQDEVIPYKDVSAFFRDIMPNCNLHTVSAANHDWVNDHPHLLVHNILNDRVHSDAVTSSVEI